MLWFTEDLLVSRFQMARPWKTDGKTWRMGQSLRTLIFLAFKEDMGLTRKRMSKKHPARILRKMILIPELLDPGWRDGLSSTITSTLVLQRSSSRAMGKLLGGILHRNVSRILICSYSNISFILTVILCCISNQLIKFPIAPMGVLAPGSAHQSWKKCGNLGT